MLEIVAFPPPRAPHLWHAKVLQLAADLGMPSGSTGRDIVTFVIQLAAVKKELDKVAPLIKKFAAAARVSEGRISVQTMLPGATRLDGIYPTSAGSNNTRKRCHDEVTLHPYSF